jgi:hypothetical protein
MTNKEMLWIGPSGLQIPTECTEPQEIIFYANGLSNKQKRGISLAFEHKAFDMGAEYTWRRSMIKLKYTLKSLGMAFIGEMLGNDEINEYSNIEMVINDFNTISLAEHLGVINATGALELRQSLEIIIHYLSDDAEKDGKELTIVDATQIVNSCVKYILGEANISLAIEFLELRKKLFSKTIAIDDPQMKLLLDSPAFFLKTVISVLVSAIKKERGATLEHVIGNLSSLIEHIWNHLTEKDKWQVGRAYRDTTAAGNINATRGLKNALLKVKGFDYVPENLRSTSFKKAAMSLIEAHFGMNNFITEIPLVLSLSKLGTSIPAPAFIECVQAYLSVYIGNKWGVSSSVSTIAERELIRIPKDRWLYYFTKVIQTDDIILPALLEEKPRQRLSSLIRNHMPYLYLEDRDKLPELNLDLVNSLLNNANNNINSIIYHMLEYLRTGK